MNQVDTPNGMRCLRGERLEVQVKALSERMTERGRRHDEQVSVLSGSVESIMAHQERTDDHLHELEIAQAKAHTRLAVLLGALIFGAEFLSRWILH